MQGYVSRGGATGGCNPVLIGADRWEQCVIKWCSRGSRFFLLLVGLVQSLGFKGKSEVCQKFFCIILLGTNSASLQ